ncbi:MAG: glycosyltransferase family 2 protein [Leptolyngbyaceae bacterium]|nr:glycosyltransferase family 2 protein [Leptolyngbyaceae bacterium]
MTKPLVSVCMPCYNASCYVLDAVNSILVQSWDNIELIIVDDGSTDDSAALLSSVCDSRVKFIQQANRGQCAAANRAFAEAQGLFLKFFDADDVLSPGTIESQILILGEREDAIASSQWGRFYGDDLSSFRLNPEPVWCNLSATDWLVQAWRYAQPMMQCGLWLIPREILERAGGWDESLSLINDFEFFARLLCHAEEVCFTPNARLYYRSGIPGSLSSRKTRAAAESAFYSILKGTGHLLARRSDAEARLSCANMMQNFLYTFYPAHPDLRTAIAQRVAELGGSDLPPPGGPLFQRASRLIGWKSARRLQRLAGRA